MYPVEPTLSVVVVCFNMQREAARTLFTLSIEYQKDITNKDYEVIVVDNGSTQPLTEEVVASFGTNFRYCYFNNGSVSPASAVNYGVSKSKGEVVACIVDGARVVTPATIGKTIKASKGRHHPYIYTLAWHLGFKNQNEAVLEGYNQQKEDDLLETIDWQQDGYQLFDIATISQSSESAQTNQQLPAECSYFAMRKNDFLALNGFDERFKTPGGGLVNHDFLNRAVNKQKFNFIELSTEATFHQFHGGVATNVKPEDHPWDSFKAEYRHIRGVEYSQPASPTITSYDRFKE